jgi:predicted N-formylglutamate amidohydrolase
MSFTSSSPASDSAGAPSSEPRPLLGASDPPPLQVFNGDATAPVVIVCDHAGRAIPAALGTLGLDDDLLHRHIAYDIGAAQLTRLIAHRLAAPAVLATYSRLVIDCNRMPGEPQSILDVSDGVRVPGNTGIGEAERTARAGACHAPYHQAVDAQIARLRALGTAPAVFSVHTFTPSLAGSDRVWDLSVLWNRDARIAAPLIDMLRREPGLAIGDNEPYSGRQLAYTLNRHGGDAGLANVAVEVRQDHCESRWELDRWANLLASALESILALPGVGGDEVGGNGQPP